MNSCMNQINRFLLALALLCVSLPASANITATVSQDLSTPGYFILNVYCTDRDSRAEPSFHPYVEYGSDPRYKCYILPGVLTYHMEVPLATSNLVFYDDGGEGGNIPVEQVAPTAPCTSAVNTYGGPTPCSYHVASQSFNGMLAPILLPLLPYLLVILAIYMGPWMLKKYLSRFAWFNEFKRKSQHAAEREAVQKKMVKRAERQKMRVKEQNAHHETMARIAGKGDKANRFERSYYADHKDKYEKHLAKSEMSASGSTRATRSGPEYQKRMNERWA